MSASNFLHYTILWFSTIKIKIFFLAITAHCIRLCVHKLNFANCFQTLEAKIRHTRERNFRIVCERLSCLLEDIISDKSHQVHLILTGRERKQMCAMWMYLIKVIIWHVNVIVSTNITAEWRSRNSVYTIIIVPYL